MDYEYQIFEGGTYTVKAFAPGDAHSTTSNEVEINNMTIMIESLTVTKTEVSVSLEVQNPIPNTVYVTFGMPNISKNQDEGRCEVVVDSTTSFATASFTLSFNEESGIMAVPKNGETPVATSTTLSVYSISLDEIVEYVVEPSSSKWQKESYGSLHMSFSPYTHELTLSVQSDLLGLGPLGSATATFTPSETYDIEFPNTAIATYTDSNFYTHVPADATSISVEVTGDNYTEHLTDFYDMTETEIAVTADVKHLGTPTLTYSAVEGKLKWDEVEGADRYEVWKDGVKIADIPKKS